MRFVMSLAATIVALTVAGCTSRTHHPRIAGERPPPLVRVAFTESEFAYKKQRKFADTRAERETKNFRVKWVGVASSGQNGQVANLVTARYYQSKQPGRKPLVIILPIWGVHTLPSNELTREITENGGGAVNVLQIHGDRMLFDMRRVAYAPTPEIFAAHLNEMADRVVSTVIDIRRLVDWAETRPEIDPDRIALTGFSLGAMVASLALSNEQRLKAGILVLGSANPQEAFSTCGGSAGQMRKLITERFGWSVKQFRNSLERPLSRIDPARYAGRVDPRRVLVIEAGEDSCLTQASRQKFWESMGRPERIVYDYDHRATFMAMTFLGGGNLQKEAFQFLKKVFGLGPGA
jgi:dienelactone hydrolase